MLTEPMTLYKLMNLYMLKQVNFPLTNAQLTNFFTEHEYTTYFTLQQALNELEDAGLVHKEASHNSTRYDITREGEETLNFFGKNISSAIIEDMNQYLKENKFRLREEVGTTADFYKGTNQDYIVHCEVRENKTTLIRLDLFPTGSRQNPCAIHGKQKARKSMPMSCGHFYPDLLCRYTCFHREAFSLKRDLFQ
jgi:DNA-binding PadR family transcriptional regulator